MRFGRWDVLHLLYNIDDFILGLLCYMPGKYIGVR